MDKIKNISDFFEALRKHSDGSKYVFRGEVNDFGDTACVPNFYRDKYDSYNKNYELNILNKLRSEKIDTLSDSYLLTAIEAQHGGFPSRLLDVSANALIALHFAITPKFVAEIEENDNKDGIVYMIKYDNMVSPVSKEINDIFEDLIFKRNYRSTQPIFAYNHYFIDHYKKNTRINVQQGSFILFNGQKHRPLPKHLVIKLKIPKEYKKKIREELKQFFSITNAFVYPEPDNLVEMVKEMSVDYIDSDFGIQNELDRSHKAVIKSLEYLIRNWYSSEVQSLEKIIVKINNNIERFKIIPPVKSQLIDLETKLSRFNKSIDIKSNLKASGKKLNESDRKIIEEALARVYKELCAEYESKFNECSIMLEKSVKEVMIDLDLFEHSIQDPNTNVDNYEIEIIKLRSIINEYRENITKLKKKFIKNFGYILKEK